MPRRVGAWWKLFLVEVISGRFLRQHPRLSQPRAAQAAPRHCQHPAGPSPRGRTPGRRRDRAGSRGGALGSGQGRAGQREPEPLKVTPRGAPYGDGRPPPAARSPAAASPLPVPARRAQREAEEAAPGPHSPRCRGWGSPWRGPPGPGPGPVRLRAARSGGERGGAAPRSGPGAAFRAPRPQHGRGAAARSAPGPVPVRSPQAGGHGPLPLPAYGSWEPTDPGGGFRRRWGRLH